MIDRAAPALHDSERQLRLFVEGVRDYAVFMLDLEGLVVSWNTGAEAIKGYDTAEILGRHFSCFYTPEDIVRQHPALSLKRARETGRFEETGVRQRKDGSRFTANVLITAIHDDDGTLVGYGKITRDISERVETAERLRSSDARLRSMVDTLLETLVDGLIVTDHTGHILVFNQACSRLFGYPADEAVGQNVGMLMPELTQGDHDGYLRAYRETGRYNIIGKPREVVGRRKDGSIFPMRLSVGEANHDGEQIFVGILHDLTEQKLTEDARRQSQKLEAVGQLTGGIAHDFNNILTVILANADALQEENLDVGLTIRLDQIAQAVLRASSLTRQLLAFSRKQPLLPQRTDINDLVAAIGSLLRRALGEQVEINSILADALWTVNIDRSQLETALVNLCVNARDAMPNGGKLVIETQNVTLDQNYVAQNPDAMRGDHVMLAVTDRGTGIPPDVLERVFEPFFTTKEVGKGTGLGLSMVYGFIKQSNGHIKIESEVGRGTSFKLYLPRSDGVAEEVVVRQSAPLLGGTERILVVEDNPQVLASVVQQLQSLGYAVSGASDGQAGVASLEATPQPYDLLLTDIVMPGPLDGKGLADEVARRWPATKIVFMSGYSQDAIVHHGLLDVGVLLLSKPFRKRDLAEIVRQALDDADQATSTAS